MGYGRGGWYSYDWLERRAGAGDFAEGGSARRVIPQLQRLVVGDTVALGPSGGLTVAVLDPPKALVLHYRMNALTAAPARDGDRFVLDWTWAFLLIPTDEDSCRLLVRVRAKYRPRWLFAFIPLVLEPAHLIMERKMLRTIKRQARSGAWLARNVSNDRSERDAAHAVSQPSGAVDLYWIPLGAGAHVVRLSGKLFEAVSALVQRRGRCGLYHSALEVNVPEGRFVIEQTPIPDLHGDQRGVVAEGPVGTRWAGRFRLFRYEIRRWHEGGIPDIHEAIASPVRLSDDLTLARRILHLLPSVPTPVWGRDEFDAGEMWNSNSVISWVLARSGAEIATVHPPNCGRAPGWDAGLVVAARDLGREKSR
jgi:hypothetical protein